MKLEEMQDYEEAARELLLKRFNKILTDHDMPKDICDQINEKGMFNALYSRYWGVLTLVLNNAIRKESKQTDKELTKPDLEARVEKLEAELMNIKKSIG